MFPLEAGTLGKVSLKVVSLPLDAATLGKIDMTFHSEWPSDRNDLPLEVGFPFEIASESPPKGPMGPFPPKGAEGALGSPWVPLGPLGFPWVSLGPLPPPRDLDQVVATK